MTLDSNTCYRALRSRDARFDGRFFVAVSSTRIYCLPVCTVKPPKRENCRFYPSAAAADRRLRPCCAAADSRREASVTRPRASLMRRQLIETQPVRRADAVARAWASRRICARFRRRVRLSPFDFSQTQLLCSPSACYRHVASLDAGGCFARFGILRRFNALFSNAIGQPGIRRP